MKRFFRLSAALAALALLSGCASLLHPRLVEDLQLIQTIGFDGGIGDMTVSVSSGEASEDAVSAQLAARGASIQTAVQRLQDFSPREELFFAHIRYAAVGEDCARGGITPILDYFERGTQTQLSVPLFVVKGESAYTLVAANGGENEITAALSSLEADTKRQGSAHCFTVLEIASRLNRSGAALACAIAPTAPERSVPEAEDGATLALEAGYAVFRGETLCGFLDTDAALGADLLLGFAPQASYVLPDGSGGTVTVQLHTAKASLSPVRNGGETAVRIAVRVRAGVTEFLRRGHRGRGNARPAGGRALPRRRRADRSGGGGVQGAGRRFSGAVARAAGGEGRGRSRLAAHSRADGERARALL